jgi:hypothetical protein
MLKNLHELSLHVVNLVGNQKLKNAGDECRADHCQRTPQIYQSRTQKISMITATKKPHTAVNL